MCSARLQHFFYECESEVIRETSLCWRPIWTKPYFLEVIIVQFAYWCAVLVPRTSKRTGINLTDTPIQCTVQYVLGYLYYGTVQVQYITVPHRTNTLLCKVPIYILCYRYRTVRYRTVISCFRALLCRLLCRSG